MSNAGLQPRMQESKRGAVNSAAPHAPIIIASDGSGSALAAMRAAKDLAALSGSPVRLMSVIEPYAHPTDMPDVVSWPAVSIGKGPSTRAEHVRAEFRAIGGDDTTVDLDVDIGNPGTVISRAAAEIGASLIVTGLGRHTSAQRFLGGETLIDLAQVTGTPLLATTSFNRRPERILVAIDSEIPGLSSSSIPTALFENVKSVYCVHVEASRPWLGNADRKAAGSSLDLEREIPCRLCSLLELPAEALVQGITLQGEASKEILDFASRFNIDLIVIGRRQRNLLQRMFSEGKSARILRRARCSVLLLPPAAQRGDLHTLSISNPSEWPALLNRVTERDTGRRVQVEIDDIELGAQFEATAFRLAGIAYDHKDERVELMLGGLGSRARHLSHSVADVRSVDLLFGPDGKDVALRIAYGGGQMLLCFLN